MDVFHVFREDDGLTITLPVWHRDIEYDVFALPNGALQINMHAGADEARPEWKHYGTYTAVERSIDLYPYAALENIKPDDIPAGMYEIIKEGEGNLTLARVPEAPHAP